MNDITQLSTLYSNAIARAEKAEEALREWQPIETAPKDGEFVDLWHKSGVRFTDCRWFTNRIGYTCWHVQTGGRVFNAGPDSEFTHWQPLPLPPPVKETP